MKTKLYINNEKIVAGITLKDESQLESNNMALHACDNLEDVLENRKKLAAFLDCGLDDFVCAKQTHSANFQQVTFDDKGRGSDRMETAIPDTDALYTYEPDVLLCSFNADCVPVTFYHEGTGVVGVIHSGWQGSVKEITLKLFKHLIQEENCHPNDFHVQICPALSQEKFEVDEDVYIKFKDLGYADDFIYYNEQTNKYHIDNQLTVKKQCMLAGIPEENISIDRTCTYVSDEGFSHRQDKRSGRHLCFIMKKEG
ncbi:peptidoglycan editing factor PgeF [Lederbergia wuyishanensis]|uniref:Purine nucleoside phosphorylase n=1 Tax=Lederbergia wuyishanensis TaxID=1347903 RepID=A0ABU0D341_9BACI|nr:peptidoglycan editing factor PgeF [Lederbergia wuyishanensis]MCJ8007063.1 peptidoglycan editing factor PgeF [Lederbergia wuyishanensis]MDQ0342793.1 YfiH family protein [Lederbergia wuyishanensis]